MQTSLSSPCSHNRAHCESRGRKDKLAGIGHLKKQNRRRRQAMTSSLQCLQECYGPRCSTRLRWKHIRVNPGTTLQLPRAAHAASSDYNPHAAPRVAIELRVDRIPATQSSLKESQVGCRSVHCDPTLHSSLFSAHVVGVKTTDGASNGGHRQQQGERKESSYCSRAHSNVSAV